MEERVFSEYSETSQEQDYKINFPTVVSRVLGHTMAEVMYALDAVVRAGNISVEVHDSVVRAQLLARDLIAKVTALANLFDDSEIASPIMASYEVEPFLDLVTKQISRAIADKINSKISFEIIDGTFLDAIFDQRRVASILYYLISNSLQHGRTENKNVKIICKSTLENLEFTVRDYGGGVPKEIQPILFNKFQDKYDITKEIHGMLPPQIQGIGLPMCRKLTRDMGGELLFRNFRSGAQFTLIIPQKIRGMQEISTYIPDDILLQNCMSSLFLYLYELNKGAEQ